MLYYFFKCCYAAQCFLYLILFLLFHFLVIQTNISLWIFPTDLLYIVNIKNQHDFAFPVKT